MILYSSIFTNQTGAFPSIVAQDVTAPGAGNGTEFIAAMVNDEWGARQDLINRAGLTPDTVTEASGTSQTYEAMQLCFGHPGELVGWHGAGDPSTFAGLRLLLLDGSGITAANYPDLVDAAWVGAPANADPTISAYFKADNANGTPRNPVGVWFILPDTRGMFLRGFDPTAVRDPDGTNRLLVPSTQVGAFETHGHEVRSLLTAVYAGQADVTAGGIPHWALDAALNTNRLQARDQTAEIIGGYDDSETRPINLTVRWCVRY